MNRNTYGALTTNEGREIVCEAIKKGILDAEYCDVDRKHRGSALNYDVYDIKGNTVLIQKRVTTCTKYGNSPKKDYYFLVKTSRKIKLVDVNKFKMTVAKLAKSACELGQVIDCINGKQTLKIKQANASVAPTMAYKQVALVDGKMFSIFDGSTEYVLGNEMIQRAKAEHAGGYYCYETIEEAKNAEFPSSSVYNDQTKIIIQVEVSGRRIKYSNGKMSFSHIKSIKVVE